MHEFGHALGLRHGGADDTRYKPNYRSVMNYTWQTPVPLGTAPTAAHVQYHNAWRLDYSRVVLNELNEAALSEPGGIGGDPNVSVPIGFTAGGALILVPEGGAADFNASGPPIDFGTVAADINYVDGGGASPGEVLRGHNDWSALKYDFRRNRDFADGLHVTADVNEVTHDFMQDLADALETVPNVSVSEFRVNDGLAQRSLVTSLRLTFDRPIALSAANFTLGGFAGTLSVVSQVIGVTTIATITFGGSGVQNGSLADGRYTLSVIGVPGLTGTTTFAVHRLFGDTDGDGDVDATDNLRFRRALGSVSGQPTYRADLDFDGDGDIDAADNLQFRSRLGTILPP
jgi:hypothetical protein